MSARHAQIHIAVPSGQALEIAVRQLLMPQCTMEFIQNPQGFPSDFGERMRKGGHKVTRVVGCVMLWLENATRKSYQAPGEFQPCWPSKTISMLVDRYEKGQGAGSCSWPSVEVPWRPQGPSGNMLFAGRGMSKSSQGTHSASSILMVSRRSSAVASSAAFNWRSRELASLRWVNLGNLEGQFLVHGRLKKWGSPMF